MEATADLIVHTPSGHRFQGLGDHLQRPWVVGGIVVAQQEFQHHRLGELGRPAPSAVRLVEIPIEILKGGIQRFTFHAFTFHALGYHHLLFDGVHQLLAALNEFLPPVSPGIGYAQQDLGERGHPVARRRRKVGASVKWLPIRREEHRHRPAAATGQRLHRAHIDAVQVWPLLPVHLDADKVLVQNRSHALLLERLVRHHVAPVAGGVANAEKDGLVLGPRSLQRSLSPGIPIHRVVSVLEQVRAGLVDQVIGHQPLTPESA